MGSRNTLLFLERETTHNVIYNLEIWLWKWVKTQTSPKRVLKCREATHNVRCVLGGLSCLTYPLFTPLTRLRYHKKTATLEKEREIMSASVFVPSMAVGVPMLSRSSSVHRSLEPAKKKTMSSFKFVTNFRNLSTNSGTKPSFRVKASDHRSEQADNGQGIQVSSVESTKLLFLVGGLIKSKISK